MSAEEPTEKEIEQFNQQSTLDDAIAVCVDITLDPERDFDAYEYITTGIEQAINAQSKSEGVK